MKKGTHLNLQNVHLQILGFLRHKSWVSTDPEITWKCFILLGNHPGLQKPNSYTHLLGTSSTFRNPLQAKIVRFLNKPAKFYWTSCLIYEEDLLFSWCVFLLKASLTYEIIGTVSVLIPYFCRLTASSRCQAQKPEGTQHREDPDLPSAWAHGPRRDETHGWKT